MIKQTLFIGVGTTGTEILKHLRQLMFEEFIDYAGLPIFRYVAIETDKDEDGTDKQLRLTRNAAEYEKIHMIHATVPNTDLVQNKIDPDHYDYNPNLHHWLDPEVLKIGERAFEAGAANVRMAGRLCLWENWDDVTQQLIGHQNAIIAPANINETMNFLTNQYFPRKKTPADGLNVMNTPNVYVVGSLCGGTCSGMLIDLGYYLSTLFTTTDSNGGGPRVVGYFTIYDRSLALEAANAIRAANCYGALYELNFYGHQDTLYENSFPDGQSIKARRDPPYDYTLFVGRSGKNPAVKFNKESGAPDEDGWNQMVAMDLFSEVVAGSGGEKNAIRVNWHAHGDYRQSKPPDHRYVRNMASLGLTAVWYPKYRIATAAASLIGEDLCESWLGDSTRGAEIEHGAAAEWKPMLAEKLDILTSISGKTPIRQEINQLLTTAEAELGKCQSAQELQQRMMKYPPNKEFAQRFGKGGEYYDLMRGQVSAFETALKADLWRTFKEKVSQLATVEDEGKPEGKLDDVRQYFSAIDKRLAEQIKICPEQQPQFELNINFRPMTRVERDKWMSLAKTQRKALNQYRAHFIRQYKERVNSTFRSLRNHLIRGTLISLREEIGIGRLPDPDVIEPRLTIAGEVQKIQTRLEGALNEFKRQYNEAIKPPRQIHVKIVANNPQNDLDFDARRLQRQVSVGTGLNKLLQGSSLYLFLTGDEGYVEEMKTVYLQEALGRIDAFNVLTKADDLLRTTNEILTLAERSTPYQEFKTGYKQLPIPGGSDPKLIIGPSVTQNDLPDFVSELQNRGIPFRYQISHVDHLLIFYQEEAGFAMDDLASFDILKNRFGARPGQYGHLTHRDEAFYDLEFMRRVQKLQRWLAALNDLYPAVQEERSDRFKDTFLTDARDNTYYMGKHGHDEAPLYLNGENINDFARSENLPMFETFENEIRWEFHQVGENLTKDIRNKVLNRFLQEEGEAKRQQKQKEFNEFLAEIFDPKLPSPLPPEKDEPEDLGDEHIPPGGNTPPVSTPAAGQTMPGASAGYSPQSVERPSMDGNNLDGSPIPPGGIATSGTTPTAVQTPQAGWDTLQTPLDEQASSPLSSIEPTDQEAPFAEREIEDTSSQKEVATPAIEPSTPAELFDQDDEAEEKSEEEEDVVKKLFSLDDEEEAPPPTDLKKP